MAALAQKNMLPHFHENILGFKLESSFTPSSYVSGDMYGCFEIAPNRLGFYMIDVSGHGVQAALLSVTIGHILTPNFFKEFAMKTPTPDPAAVLSTLNQKFFSDENDRYFTMFCGIIDTITGELTFCQGGHPSPIMLDQNANVTLIGEGGFPVALIKDVEFENQHCVVDHGSTIYIFSDAATESSNEQGESFGDDRLCNMIAENYKDDRLTMLEDIKRVLITWQSNKPLTDDLTLVAIERL